MPKQPTNYAVKANDHAFTINSSELDASSIIKKSNNEFNIIHNHRSVNAFLIESDSTGKKVKIEVEGETFDIVIKDELDQMLEKMGFGIASTKHIKDIKAPMPGLVLEIAVKDGQEVKNGDKILILEAMKMENSIIIHADATIKRVMVKAGQAVEKGQLLVELV